MIEPDRVRLVPAVPGNGGTTAGAVSPKVPSETVEAEKLRLAAINRKLASIIVPNLMFRNTTVRDGIEFLRNEAQLRDTGPDLGQPGVNIVLAVPAELANRRVTLTRDNVPLIDALREVVGLADLKVAVEPYTVVVEAKDQ